MNKIFKKLMVLLDGRQKRIMIVLVIMMLIGAVLETAGVGMVIPVMQMVLDEHAVEKSERLQTFCDILHIAYDDSRTLIIVTMLALIMIFVLKNIFLFFQQDDDQFHAAPVRVLSQCGHVCHPEKHYL